MEKQINCSKHNETIITLIQDSNLPLNQRLFCVQCIKEAPSMPSSINFQVAQQMIKEKQDFLSENVREMVQCVTDHVTKFKQSIEIVQSDFIKQFDKILGTADLWIQNLIHIQDSIKEFSLLNELDKLNEPISHKIEQLCLEIRNCNQSYCKKMNITNEPLRIFYLLVKEMKTSLLNLEFFPRLTQQGQKLESQGKQQQFQLYNHKVNLICTLMFQHQNILNDWMSLIEENFRKQQSIPADKITGKVEHIGELQQLKIMIYQLTRLFNEFRVNYFDKTNLQQPPNQKITCQLINNVAQSEKCFSIAFNKDGSLMFAGCAHKINIWEMKQGQLQIQNSLEAHHGNVLCLASSKQNNWFASAGIAIKLWKETPQSWICSSPQSVHTKDVLCLIMNKNEDQLFSCSRDTLINVWKITYSTNSLIYEYTLYKHTSEVWQVSLNPSETFLVSCGLQKEIYIWCKDGIWKFHSKIQVGDFGRRIYFVDDNTIAWQQQGIAYIHKYQLENGSFGEKKNLQIKLNHTGNDAQGYFHQIYNHKKQVLISKHNHYVYILTNQSRYKLNFQNQYFYGSLTNDGQYLVIWIDQICRFYVYKIKIYS